MQSLSLRVIHSDLREPLLHVRGITDLFELLLKRAERGQIFIKVLIQRVNSHPEVIELFFKFLKVLHSLDTPYLLQELFIILTKLSNGLLQLVIDMMHLNRNDVNQLIEFDRCILAGLVKVFLTVFLEQVLHSLIDSQRYVVVLLLGVA